MTANRLLQYDVDSRGRLEPKSPAAIENPWGYGMTVSPNGRSLYTTSDFGTTISPYAIGAGGLLSSLSAPIDDPAGSAMDIITSPDGRSVYVADAGGVAQFEVGAGGALTPGSPPTVAGPGGRHIATSPPPLRTRLRLSALSLSPVVFPGAGQGPAVSLRHSATGTEVRYRISVPALLDIRVARRTLAGRRFTASFTVVGGTGVNAFHFSGRVGGRKLAPGRYVLTARPRASGRRGRAVATRFTIIR